jgi:hypothetical protein
MTNLLPALAAQPLAHGCAKNYLGCAAVRAAKEKIEC